jgi:hypothetical protein
MAKDPQAFPSDAADKFMVRFPDGMRDRINEAAKAAGRSMNAEIVARLASTFKPEQQTLDLGMAPLSDAIHDLKEEMKAHHALIASLMEGGAKVGLTKDGKIQSIEMVITPKTSKGVGPTKSKITQRRKS